MQANSRCCNDKVILWICVWNLNPKRENKFFFKRMEESEQHHLSVGTEVSAKYRGAFCEAKIKSLKKVVVYKVSTKKDGKLYTVAEDCLKGSSKVGSVVEVQIPELSGWHDAVINAVKDKSVYTVEFDDGDERTLSRGSLCLQGVRHFAEGDTLDHLPLTDPENFGTPVLNSKRKAKKKPPQAPDVEEPDSDDQKMSETEPVNKRKLIVSKSEPKSETLELASVAETRNRWLGDRLMGKLVLVEPTDKRKHWYPAVCVNPLCIDEECSDLSEDQIVVRSFKTGKITKVLRCDRLSRNNIPSKVEPVWKDCLDNAFSWEETGTIPDVWKMDIRHIQDDEGRDASFRNKESEEDEEKNNDFLEQLYKFMDDCGCSINKTPVLGYKDLDLFLLYNLVQAKGGFHNISSPADWREIYSDLGIPKLTQAAGHHAKMAYSKYLLNFEEYMKTFEKSQRNKASKNRSEPAKSSRKLLKSKSFRAEDDAEPASRRTSRRRKLSETMSVTDEHEASPTNKDHKRSRKNKVDPEVKRDSDVDDASSTASSEKSINRSKLSTCSASEVKSCHKMTDRRRSNSGKKQPIYKAGDKLRVKYGKDSFKLYSAKVVDVEIEENNEVQYYVHYAGWNSRHDEWIKPWRISSYVGDKNNPPNSPTPQSKPPSRSSVLPTLNDEQVMEHQLASTIMVKLVQGEGVKGVALDLNTPANDGEVATREKRTDDLKILKTFQSESKNVNEKQPIKGRIRRRSTSSSTPPFKPDSCHSKRATSVEKFIPNETKKEAKDRFVTHEQKSPKSSNHSAVPLGLFPVHRRTSGRRSKSPAYLKESALYGLTKRKRNSNSVSNDAAPPNEVQDVDDLSSETSSPSDGSSATDANRASPLTVWSEADNFIEKNLKPDRKQTQRKAVQNKKLLTNLEEKMKSNHSDVKNETYDNFDEEAPNIELEKKNKTAIELNAAHTDLPMEPNPEPSAPILDCPTNAQQSDANEETGEEAKKNSKGQAKEEDASSSNDHSSSSSASNSNDTSSAASSSSTPEMSSNRVEPSQQPNQAQDGAASSSKTLMENTPPTTPEQSPEHYFNEPETNPGSSGPGLSSGAEVPASASPNHRSTTERSAQDEERGKPAPRKSKHTRSQQSPHRKDVKNNEAGKVKRKNGGESDSDEDGSKNKPVKRKKPKKKSKRDPPTAPTPISHQELSAMTPDQKIQVLQNKLAEMRNVYQQLKQEVSSIDRKRKRAKRREQEALEQSAKKSTSSLAKQQSVAGSEHSNPGAEKISLDIDPVSV